MRLPTIIPFESSSTAVGVGIDGCRCGWIAAAINSSGSLHTIVITKNVKSILSIFEGTLHLIDMPLGLPNHQHPQRECDQLVRRSLGKRASSVFSPPTREALVQHDYYSACLVNAGITGKKISVQAWNLRSKIQELDLAAQPHEIFESHPELCFRLLKGEEVIHSKKTSAGRIERLSILDSYLEDLVEAERALSETLPRAHVSSDDLLDAIVLAISAHKIIREPEKKVQYPAHVVRDNEGKRMQIQAWAPSMPRVIENSGSEPDRSGAGHP